jgi:hypothetical protein
MQIGASFTNKPLHELAQIIEELRAAEREAGRNALRIRLDIGSALLAVQERLTSDDDPVQRVAPSRSLGWKRWLRLNCPSFSVRTAFLYQQLARHRSEIEREIARTGEMSVREAVRFVTAPSPRQPKKPTPDLVAALRKASAGEVAAALESRGFNFFLQAIPAAFRPQLEERIVSLRADKGEPVLKVTSILRKALSLIKVASAPGTSAAVGRANEQEALVALRQLNGLLISGGFDLNDLVVNAQKTTSEPRRQRRAA